MSRRYADAGPGTYPSPMSRRATGFAITVLLTSVVSLLAGTTPAHATEVDRTIGYRCDSDYGSGASDVRIKVTIPDTAFQGVEVPSRKVVFKIEVPAEMVAMLQDYGVDSVSAVGRAHYTIGTLKKPIRHLRVPETEVPASGGMTLRGTGRAASFTINQPGTYAVKVTRTLTATATAHGTPLGDLSTDLTCNVRRGESRRLASIEVVR